MLFAFKPEDIRVRTDNPQGSDDANWTHVSVPLLGDFWISRVGGAEQARATDSRAGSSDQEPVEDSPRVASPS